MQEFVTLSLIALSLTFDTFAISVSSGIIQKNISFLQALRISIILGIIQASLALTGWFIGTEISHLIQKFDKILAFIFLFIIGARMIYEAFRTEENKEKFNPLDLKVIIAMGIATSIDALIVGVSLAFAKYDMKLAFVLINFFTFIVAMLGMLIGKKGAKYLGNKAEIIGGIVIILVGLKIALGR
jgi:putative Mn2+ efflux pump MntP